MSNKGVIELGRNYRIKPEKLHGWILEIRSDGLDKHKNPKDVWTQLYYPTFEKIASRVIDEEIKEASSLQDLLKILAESKEVLAKALVKIESCNI